MVVVTHDHKAVNVDAVLLGSVGQAIIEDSFSIAGGLEKEPSFGSTAGNEVGGVGKEVSWCGHSATQKEQYLCQQVSTYNQVKRMFPRHGIRTKY